MYYILKFKLTKSEGRLPSKADVSTVFPNSDYEQVLKESLKFSFHNDNNLLPVVDWKLVDDGKESLQINGANIPQHHQLLSEKFIKTVMERGAKN